MAMFRRRPKDGDEPEVRDDALEAQSDVDEIDEPDEPTADAGATTPVPRTHGPWDAADDVDDRPRVDLGALHVPGVPGMELRMEIDKTTNVVSAASVSVDGSTLQLQAYAAPRTEGIWDEIRGEIQQSVVAQGGAADDLPGPFGRELLARLPARTPEGRTGHRPARFLGVDGPRWFLRGVITGRAAVEPAAAQVLEQVFGGVVVVRGQDARPPRDLLALKLPGQASAAPVAPEPEQSLDPLTRGPEITETR
ncbi:DUF3710 domain-containing protein [Cellulomonas fulva]|nr:DUF3710 domain-containing protein [Cellulomonas fulva]